MRRTFHFLLISVILQVVQIPGTPAHASTPTLELIPEGSVVVFTELFTYSPEPHLWVLHAWQPPDGPARARLTDFGWLGSIGISEEISGEDVALSASREMLTANFQGTFPTFGQVRVDMSVFNAFTLNSHCDKITHKWALLAPGAGLADHDWINVQASIGGLAAQPYDCRTFSEAAQGYFYEGVAYSG